ncbi:MAG: hypothetical protein GWN21_18255 [Gammaproteobacteria bacterium]|nr:hypothetical protein [Gammaproteobacteria bacterium]NIV49716.1 hypothetical protein [Gammaproteobacteria bacterium]NIW57114.1 hypothetical protein [Gammaproteobacteria bacterium]
MIALNRSIALVLCGLMIAQTFYLQSDFAQIDTAEKLIEQYERPTLLGAGLFIVCGFAVSLMAFFRAAGWRIGVIAAVGLYVWTIWYPDFLRLVLKYGAANVISGLYDQAVSAGTLGSVLTHYLLYPLGFAGVLVATLWDLKGAGSGE